MLKELVRTSTLLLIGVLASSANSQTLINVDVKKHACSFAPDEVIENEIYSFASSKEAEDLVKRIVSTVGLVPRFDVFAANVPNAAAIIDGEDRLIVYSESWIRNTIPDNKWAVVALMSHEIAHHLNGHTLEAGGSRPPTELEADKFAGFAVGKLGGSLQDAQWLFRQLPKAGSDTHPPQSARLEAVAVGWRDATGGGTLRSQETVQETQERPTGYIIPVSSQRILTTGDLRSFSKPELRLARNEIFARKGRFFQSADLSNYFSQFDWYQPFTFDVELTAVEKENVAIIKAEERLR